MDRNRRLSASLIYDTREQSLPQGLRAVVQRTRCLLYVAEEFEVLLQVSPDAPSDRAKILGELSLDGAPYEGAGVRLSGSADHPEQTTDSEGAFRFALLMSGDYRLAISTPNCRIDVGPLSI